MEREPDPPDDDELVDELEDEPQARPGRVIVGSFCALLGLAGVVVSAAYLMGPPVTPENSQGEISVILAPLVAVVMIVVLLVSLILLFGGGAAAITALIETRAARRR